MLLVLHKVGPALAAGNAVILKPASVTPLVALKLTELLLEAGLPPLALQCITGDGSVVGRRLCADPRVRKITFTGSTAVGEDITRVAGVKRLSLELGGNAPLLVLADADVEAAATQTRGRRLRERRAGLHLDPARDRRPPRLRRLRRRARAEGRGDRVGRPVRRRHAAVGDDHRARGRPRRELDRRGGRRRRPRRRRRRPRRGGARGDGRRRRRAVDAHLPRGAVRAGRRRDARRDCRRGPVAGQRRQLRPQRRCLHEGRRTSPCATPARSSPASSRSTRRRRGAPT